MLSFLQQFFWALGVKSPHGGATGRDVANKTPHTGIRILRANIIKNWQVLDGFKEKYRTTLEEQRRECPWAHESVGYFLHGTNACEWEVMNKIM